MTSDDRLRDLIDHPPRDPEPARDLVFTARVMAGLSPRPVAGRASRGWWAVAATAAIAALALPLADDVGVTMMTGNDLLLFGEVAMAAVLLALPAWVLTRSRR